MTTMDSPLPAPAAEAADSRPATDGPMGLAAVPCSVSDTPRTDAHMLGGSYSFDGDFARELERENERRKQFIFHLAHKLQIVIGLNTSECEFLRSIGADVEMDSQNA